ncbi:MAG: P-type conjugative transfer protein TrbL [Aeromonas sp.]
MRGYGNAGCKWLLAVLGYGVPLIVWAADPGGGNIGFYDEILRQFQSAAVGWQTVITQAASWLFWTLVVISMVWTFGMMALRRADIGEFFAELVRFTIFTGFYWWLLINGPALSLAIMHSLAKLGAQAGGVALASGQLGMTPSGIVDIGFAIFAAIVDNMSLWPDRLPLSLLGSLMGLGILLLLCLIAINMLLLLVSAWFLAYAGIFFLGFGGSRWTSEMAISYYKTVLGLAAQILAMVLLIGIGKTFLDQYYGALQGDIAQTNLKSIAALLMASVVLFVLSSRLPPLLASIVTGSALGSAGIGNMVNLGTLAAAASVAGAAVASGGAAAAGGMQAVMTAFSQASANFANQGGDTLDATPRAEATTRQTQADATPFAQAAGMDNTTASAADSPSTAPAAKSERSGFMAQAAKAGQISAQAGGLLVKAAGDVAKAGADSVAGRVAQTTGGKMAAAIRASAPRAATEFSGNQLGPDASWLNQQGGFSQLSTADQQQARAAHAQWQKRSADNQLTLDDYVTYVQTRQQERNAEAAQFVQKDAPNEPAP